jgi:hypothetical protein
MSKKILPQLDHRYDEYNSKCSEDMLDVLDRRGLEQFLEWAGDRWYGSERNCRLMQEWVESHTDCYSLRNCQAAFNDLRDDGLLESPNDKNAEGTLSNPIYTPQAKPDRGVKKISTTINLRQLIGNDAQRQLVGEKPERLAELMGEEVKSHTEEISRLRNLSPIGAGVSGKKNDVLPELRAKYKASLQNPESQRQYQAKRWQGARAVVFLNNEQAINEGTLKANGPEFNALVAAELDKVGEKPH